jgi:LPS export ABC transporter protein LptC
MDTRNALSLAGALLVLGGIGYYWGMDHEQPPSPPAAEGRQPDYVLSNIRGQETDVHGRLLRRLQAPALRHYDLPQDSAEIDAPLLTLYENGREAWQLSAARGSSITQSGQVLLSDGVHAVRRAPDALALSFDTPALQVFPREERLFSNSGITVTSPRGNLSSQELEASLKTGTLTLTRNVSGNYAPSPR